MLSDSYSPFLPLTLLEIPDLGASHLCSVFLMPSVSTSLYLAAKFRFSTSVTKRSDPGSEIVPEIETAVQLGVRKPLKSSGPWVQFPAL